MRRIPIRCPGRKGGTSMSSMTNLPDIFAEAKDRYDVLSMWVALGIPGEPKIGDNFSPFREETAASPA